ncbi:flagellar motor protein MotB, partial [Methylobacterium sp. J-076]|uniref:flagellar motor protein MotB n=1 Tax=Methylobacterium sp. J-076 TaxID=2836655 RepID=UPI001FBADF08
MATIIVKKVKKGGHAHHGGAWKIAYADFVTAMMAFFLLMWLISMTTQKQKIGLAEYFAPSAVSTTNSGAGGILYGTALDTSGKKASMPHASESGAAEQGDRPLATSPGRASDRDASPPDSRVEAHGSAMASLRQALQAMPDIADLSHNIMIVPTREGVDVSLVDENGRSMFRDGSVTPYERTRRVLEAIAPTLRQLPNRLTISGHTATARPGSPPAGEPWSLTAGRALAVREILAGAGVPDDHFASVAGRADTEPVFPDDPYIASNRRVTITLRDASPPVPPNLLR